MLKALEVVKTGVGMPAFVSDASYTQFLLNEGLPLEIARDYTIAGCLDIAVTGQSRVLADPMFITPLVFEYTLNNGRDPKTGRQFGPKTGEMESFESFDDLLAAFKKQFVHFANLTAEHNAIKFQIWSELFPDPITSSLMVDAVKVGKPMHDRRFPYENGAVLNPVGMVNVADSLTAIKKLVFDEKKVSMKELKEALAANWEGNGYPDLRKVFLAAPKYGNDDDYADSIAKDLCKFFAETAVELPTYQGGRHKPSAISISAQWPGGLATGATPDGRLSGECLADGGMSAMRGRDLQGPTALMKSAMKIDQIPYQATLLNMKFHPSALKSTEDMKKLANLMKIYLASGGKHVQFNVVNAETLIEAQKEPEHHRDLVVRVAGYSAYFVELSRNTQEEIIGRTEYQHT
jgi:formate C-acetyltransferase